MIGAFVPWRAEPANRGDPGWIIEENGCQTWIGSRNAGGYGMVFIGGRTHMIHRVRYEREIGPIPSGLTLDHHCDNPSCCNPHHVKPATYRENILRSNGPAAHNARKTHCTNGHALTGDNLARRNGRRRCKTCERERKRVANLNPEQREAARIRNREKSQRWRQNMTREQKDALNEYKRGRYARNRDRFRAYFRERRRRNREEGAAA